MTLKTWIKHLEFERDICLNNAIDSRLDHKGYVFWIEYLLLKRILEQKDLYLKTEKKEIDKK